MYKITLTMAFRSIFIRPTRTIMLVTMIAVSMSMMIAIQGLYDGMTDQMIQNSKASDSGEISIYAKQYKTNKDLQHLISDADTLKERLKKEPSIVSTASRLSLEGLASTAKKSAFASLTGITLKEEEVFGHFSSFLKEGKISFEKRGAILGSQLAKNLKVHIGSKLIISTQDNSGDINAMVLKVRGIVQTNNIYIDDQTVYLPLSRLQKFLALPPQTVSQIAIRSTDETLKNRLLITLKDYDVKSFLELYPMLKQMQEMMVIFNSITFFIVMMVVFIGILGVMYVSILDRIREFGILKSIGMPFSAIRMQIIFEALGIGLISYAIGALLGLIALGYLQEVGLNLSSYAEGIERFGLPTILHASIKSDYFISTFLAIITSASISVWLPLRKIKKLHPIEVIKVNS